MVGEVWRLTERNHLWTQLLDCLLHRTLHGAIRTGCQVAAIVGSCTILKQLLKAENLADKLHKLRDARVLEVCLMTLCTEDVELKVAQVCHGHGDLGLLELVVILVLG